ncbi:flavin reductase family protein [Prauserella cavernicola]|uniref:Flavin reductase family protein n=1 Tax=Prauserella cavernicola TaxID=2800127 RepID=A0A934QWP8_9PSEU|nr:flavin reductase family protein [Prauserella cavernicola]MBK1787816.1 flavin reductase family protein [Prauserella cavernicola]
MQSEFAERRLAPVTDPATLRRAFGCHPSGVAAVCAELGGEPVGMAMSSFTSVSLDPPLVLVCADLASATWVRLRTAARIGVSILADAHDTAGTQLSRKHGDRFAGLAVSTSADGAVFLDGASVWLDCSIHEEVPAGDHVIALLRIESLSARPETDPLLFHGSRFRRIAAA